MREISEGMKVPFVWTDQSMGVKKLIIRVDGKEKAFAIDKLKTRKLVTANDTYIMEIVTTCEVRTIEIKSEKLEKAKKKEAGSSVLAKLFLQSFMKKGFKF